MNSVRFLYAAYIATWAIHGFYLATIVRRYVRLRRMRDMQKVNSGRAPGI